MNVKIDYKDYIEGFRGQKVKNVLLHLLRLHTMTACLTDYRVQHSMGYDGGMGII